MIVSRAGRWSRRRLGSTGGALRSFWSAITAVSAKELRGRMRGRRAFAVLTIYLLLLGLFSFGIYDYLRQQAALQSVGPNFRPGMEPVPIDLIDPASGGIGTGGTALSASIGHALYGGLLLLETLLVLVLAPAFTSGVISLEREKQTIDLLVTTPLSTLGMVIGKLFAALTYVFLLILASIPMASVVFAFGGIGPEDLLRGYAILFALAFGMGAIGLFISALARRTQTATVLTFVTVLVLTLGSVAVHQFWVVASQRAPTGATSLLARQHQAPEPLLWLNPFVADADLICTTAPGGAHESCGYLATVTGKPWFTSPTSTVDPGCDGGFGCPKPLPAIAECGPDVACDEPIVPIPIDRGGRIAGEAIEPVSDAVGFPRDTFWPRSVTAYLVTGFVLTLLSAQLVAPSRRLGLFRRLAMPRSLHLPRRRKTAAAPSREGPS